MPKLEVSDPTYNELSVLLKRQGREINDGSPLVIEKGTAIVPPHDFRMVAIRQNCLMAAVEIFKSNPAENILNNPAVNFLNIAQDIFNWCLKGKEIDKKDWGK